MNKAFTLIELIVTIVIIGVLSAVAIPQFGSIIASSKISTEVATATSIQTSLDTIHSNWVLNGADCPFVWGNNQEHLNGNDLNNNGYPLALGSGDDEESALDYIFRTSDLRASKFRRISGSSGDEQFFVGPASDPNGGVTREIDNKPRIGKCWKYDPNDGSFELVNCP